MRATWRCAGAGLGLLVMGAAGPALAQALDRPSEHAVKAALLLNFARFAEWPAGSPQAAAASVSICVIGRDPFGPVLERTVAGRSASQRPVVVRRPGGEELKLCHVVFVSSSEAGRIGEVLDTLADQAVVTVGESDSFARRGGLIGLVVEHDFVRFEVNLAAARRSRIELSSKLLGLARLVPAHGGP
jgi:hypothetical protein